MPLTWQANLSNVDILETFGRQQSADIKDKHLELYKKACVTRAEGRIPHCFLTDDVDNKVKMRSVCLGIQNNMKEDLVALSDLLPQIQKKVADAIALRG